MVNYARMTPVYLSQMFAMQQNDEATWKLMEDGYFSVNKSKVPFSAIGSDRGLEQENRKLKVVGGIKGIANSQKALDKYFLTAGEMSNIVTKFCETFKIADGKEKQDEHHEILGSKNERITSNVEKITAVFETHGVTFDRVDNVFNILTKKVLPNKDAQRFLDAKAIGQAKYDKFVKDKLTGEESIWDTMTKEKLSTFAANNKTVKVTLERQIVHIREERKLMTRLLIASRSRPDIDLKKYLGIYEFSVVPRSLFTPDGSLHYTKDKAIIATELRALQQGSNEMETDEVESGNAPRKAIVIDAMAFVNKIDIKKNEVQNCSDFGKCFVSRIQQEADGYHEVRVVFDRYEKKSLKANTRANRNKNVPVQYKITDATKIGHLKTKQLLSSIETKNELTAYLSHKLRSELNMDYVIVYGRTCLTNIADLDPELQTYNHEEADTGIVLHCIDISKRDPFTELVVSCSDTDVLLILLHYFNQLCTTTVFKTLHQQMNLRMMYESFSPRRCQSLLGFHAITGCDQTGKFYGHSKKSCWNVFMDAPDEIIDALAKLGDLTEFTDADAESLEKFVILLYCKAIPITVNNLADLRWHLFSKQQSDSMKLPPTPDAFRQKVLRSHYTTLQWKSSHISAPTLPDPVDFGWIWDEENSLYEAVMTTLLPGPESIIHLSVCKCKTGCSNQRCKCLKSDLKCSEMCQCQGCENNDQNDDLNDIVTGLDSKSEESDDEN